jgi:hypothetical protein
MDATGLLARIDAGVGDHNVVVFRFAKGRALTDGVLYGLLGLGILAAAIALRPSVNANAGGVVYGAAVVTGLLVLSSFWRSLNRLLDYGFADTNLLVVTPEGTVRRLRGKVRAWPLAEFPDLTIATLDRRTGTRFHTVQLRPNGADEASAEVPGFAGGIESLCLNEAGASFQHELVDDGSFGPMHAIATTIVHLARTHTR